MKVNYKIATTLILTIALTIGFKLILNPPLVNTESRNAFWLNKTLSEDKFNIIVGGDSRIYRGFSIDDMVAELPEEITGMNLGYSSAGFSQKYVNFMANRLNSEGPKFLVFGITPHAFTDESVTDELLNEYLAVSGFDRYKGIYLSKYLKYFAPYKISDLRSAWTGEYYDKLNEKFFENGWVSSDKSPESDSVSLEIYTNMFNLIKVNDSIVNSFIAQVDSLNKQGINIIGFRPPTNPSMTALEDSLSGFNETEIVKQLKAVGATWIELSNDDFNSYDGSHLDSKSARLLGKKVGLAIRDILK